MRWIRLFVLPAVLAIAQPGGEGAVPEEQQLVAATGGRLLSQPTIHDALTTLKNKLTAENKKSSPEMRAVGALLKGIADMDKEDRFADMHKEDRSKGAADNSADSIKLQKSILLKVLKEFHEAKKAKKAASDAEQALTDAENAKKKAKQERDDEEKHLRAELFAMAQVKNSLLKKVDAAEKLIKANQTAYDELKQQNVEAATAREVALDRMIGSARRLQGAAEKKKELAEIAASLQSGAAAEITAPDTVTAAKTSATGTADAVEQIREVIEHGAIADVKKAVSNEETQVAGAIAKAEQTVATLQKATHAADIAAAQQKVADSKQTGQVSQTPAVPGEWAQKIESLTRTTAIVTFVGLAASVLALVLHFRGTVGRMCKKSSRNVIDSSSDDDEQFLKHSNP